MKLRNLYRFWKKIPKIINYVLIVLVIWFLFYAISYDDNSLSINTFESCPTPDFTEFSNYINSTSIPQKLKCTKNMKLVSVSNGFVFIKNGYLCQYQCVEWLNDFQSVVKPSDVLLNGSKLPCSFFISTCNHVDSKNLKYTDVILGVDRNARLLERSNCKIVFGNFYDILVVGVGSLSYNAWKNLLPETYKTFHNIVAGVSFSKFNTVGEGRTANLLGLLTGRKQTELYESRKRIVPSDSVDDYSWIWKQLKSKGYITSFSDEWTQFGSFQYRLNGFKNQPTDYYLRTILLAAERLNLIKGLCLPSKPLHKEILEFQSQIDEVYLEVQKFSVIYLSRFSNHNSLNYIDRDLSEFIIDSKRKNPNLFLILYSDDGNFMERKYSMIEKYEERLPFLGISLPNSMEEQRTVLKRNSKILTSSFDVHATLEDLIGIYQPSIDGRHMSLLRPLPEKRACIDIDVASHWCSCFNWKTISDPSSDEKIVHLATEVVGFISIKTEQFRHICEPLTLNNIMEAQSIVPTSYVLKFKKSLDQDGFIPDMSGNTQEDIFWFRIILMTKPIGAIFTVTLAAKLGVSFGDNKYTIFKLKSKDIVRLTVPSKLLRCIKVALKENQDLLQEMEQFCVCKDLNNYF